jgi:osmotically inducible lipoprotein OsmB
MKQKYIALLLLTILPLTACGNTQMDRTLSGAGLGAGAGLVTHAVVGGSLGGAMLLGAGAGALTGALTDNGQINLGKAAWR